MGQNNSNEEFLKKIDQTFPETGLVLLPSTEDVKDLVLHCRSLALALMQGLPHCRERSLAFSRLEEAFLWAVLGRMRK